MSVRTRRRARLPWHVAIPATAYALALLEAPLRPAHGAVWTNVNPGAGGAFTCAGVGPTGIVVVGSDIGGVYRSDDHGVSWENIGYLNGGLERAYISTVAFDPGNGWLVHLGTDGGLYRSTNGAKTFSLKFDSGFWSSIAVAPSDPNIVYAARHSTYSSTDPQIYRSQDQGLTWQFLSTLPTGSRVIKLEVKPTNPSHLLAVSGYEKLCASTPPRRALYVSSNGGANWTDAHGDSTSQGMTGNPWDASYDPIHPDTIFATSVVGAGNPDETGNYSGYTWRGRQSGGVWTQVSAHTGAIALRYGTGQIVTIDARRDGPGCPECGVFKSVNWGASWTRVSDMTGWDAGWNGSIAWAYNSSVAGMAKTIRRDPSNWGALYWITTQFVWRSTDWGASFHNVFTNPAAPGYWSGRGLNNVAPAALSASGTMLYAGYYDLGIWRSLDAGTSWQASNDPAVTGGWQGKGGNCMTILADPARPNMVWASQGDAMTSASVVRNTSSALPGAWTVALGVPSGLISGLALDPASSSSNRTLYVSRNGDVYKSVDDGANWALVFNSDSCYVNAAHGNRVFTGGPRGLWRSLDGGTTWSELAPATFHPGPNAYPLNQAKWDGPRAIMITGDTVDVAVRGKYRGFYRSVNGGVTWSLMRPDEAAMEITRDEYGTLYAGSSTATNAGGSGPAGATGVHVSKDLGATWTSLNSGLPWPFAWQIETVSEGGGPVRLFVASPGSGIWTSLTEGGVPLAVGDGAGSGLRLAGFVPNPARERIAVSFTLPVSGPASIEVYDLAGRRLHRREVGGMGPGSHVLPLGTGFRPAPGVYTVRLVQGSHSVHARAVIVR